MSHLVFLLAFSCLFLAAVPIVRSTWFVDLSRAVDAFAARSGAALALCATLSLVGSMLVALFVMWPEPHVHDEFSYLLAADTFAQGRLTNPTHPLWQHFESFHIFHEPTYASKYPPAQGAMLALGQVLTGWPLAGVWLGGAFMCAAIGWMLYAYVGPRWALLGALVATLRIGIATYWTQTYWGGAIAAAGGALVFGAAPRLARGGRGRDAVVLGLGLLVIANSRPIDGAITSLAAAGYLAVALWRDSRRLRPALLPLVVVLGIGSAAMGTYNRTVTGHWWLHPYLHHDRAYIAQPTLLFQEWRPTPEYRHEELRRVHVGLDPKTAGHSGSALTARSFARLRLFHVGLGMLLPFGVGVACAVVSLEGVMLLLALILGGLALGLLHFFQIHYAATIAGPVFALIAIGLERIAALDPHGRRFGEAFCVAALASTLIGLVGDVRDVPNIQTSFGVDDFYFRRRAAIETLTASPGRDLVIVKYGPEHRLHAEWVYNDADIDLADIVWARDMGAERNRELLDYYPDRRKWRLRNGFGGEADGLAPYED